MATVNIRIIGTLLIASVTGDVTADEVIAVINEHYPRGIIKDVIWDLTRGTIQSMSQEDLKAVVKASNEASLNGLRQGGKTVFVANDIPVYVMFRNYSALAEREGAPVEFNLFRDIEAAKNWIHSYWY